jgi:hypothetical protein
MLNAQKRHQAPCHHAEWHQHSCSGKGAHCPVLIIGTLKGRRGRPSTAKFLPPDKARDLEAARDLALLWERVGNPSGRKSIGRRRPTTSIQHRHGQPWKKPSPRVHGRFQGPGQLGRDASEKATIFERRTARDPKNRSGPLLPTKSTSLLWFCDHKGIRFLSELDLNAFREWRRRQGRGQLGLPVSRGRFSRRGDRVHAITQT